MARTQLYTWYHLGDRTLATFHDFGLGELSVVVVHDRYQNYDSAVFASLVDQLCTAHVLRDLADAAECYPHAAWPTQIADALRDLIHAPNTAGTAGVDIDTRLHDTLIEWLRAGVASSTGRRRSASTSDAPADPLDTTAATVSTASGNDRHHTTRRGGSKPAAWYTRRTVPGTVTLGSLRTVSDSPTTPGTDQPVPGPQRSRPHTPSLARTQPGPIVGAAPISNLCIRWARGGTAEYAGGPIGLRHGRWIRQTCQYLAVPVPVAGRSHPLSPPSGSRPYMIAKFGQECR